LWHSRGSLLALFCGKAPDATRAHISANARGAMMRIRKSRMKALLNNEFAPVTFSWGFVKAPFPVYSEAFVSWWKKLAIEFEITTLTEDLRNAFRTLEPLQSPQNRYLILETKSPWTAVFSNGLRTGDVAGAVGHLCKILDTFGLEVTCIPDRSRLERERKALRIYGAVAFTLSGPKETDWLNRVRHVSAMNDGGKWVFDAEGEEQLYEQLNKYAERKIADRFRPEMLESYCSALQINLFDSNFYGPKGLLVHQLTKFPHTSPEMSISEANARLHL
jgi:hypothetical protein